MVLTWDALLPLDVAAAWRVFTDFQAMKRCFPACETLSVIDSNLYEAVVKVPIAAGCSASFRGTVALTVLSEHHEYHLTIRMVGASGSGLGHGLFQFEPEGAGTRLTMTWEVTFGGKIASMGNAVLKCVAHTILDQFFQNLAQFPMAAIMIP